MPDRAIVPLVCGGAAGFLCGLMGSVLEISGGGAIVLALFFALFLAERFAGFRALVLAVFLAAFFFADGRLAIRGGLAAARAGVLARATGSAGAGGGAGGGAGLGGGSMGSGSIQPEPDQPISI